MEHLHTQMRLKSTEGRPARYRMRRKRKGFVAVRRQLEHATKGAELFPTIVNVALR